MTYGKKKIFDMATMTSREEDLTPEEIAQCESDTKKHEAEQEVYAKNKYLEDRKADLDWPTIEEKVNALWSGDKAQIDAINERIKVIEAKYPGVEA